MDKSYIAFFVIGDNDGTFDADDTLGAIKDPVSLVTTGSLPNNGNSGSSNDDGGSSSGCTVGSTPSYDLSGPAPRHVGRSRYPRPAPPQRLTG